MFKNTKWYDNKLNIMRKMLLYVIAFFFFAGKIFSVSINPEFVQLIVKENKFFIDFINPHVSNFRTDDYYTWYKEAIDLDFEANVLYLSGDYVKSYNKIIESQKKLRKLYYDILVNRYEVDAAQLFKMSGPIILLAKDKQAEYDLRTGYSFLGKALEIRKTGFSTNSHMLSLKIKYYIEAINMLIKAKKYALLAIIESATPLMDKKNYKAQSIDVAMKRIESIEISDYDFLKNEIINDINKHSIPGDYPFLLHHNDNYRQIDESRKSLLNEIGDSLNSRVKGFKTDKTPSNDTTVNPTVPANNLDKAPDKKEGDSGVKPEK